MSEQPKPRLRLLRGGRDGLRLGPLLVKVAPPEEPPFAAAATVVEEDTWLVLSAAPEIKAPAGHPLRILTGLLAAEPLAPGSVVVGSQVPLRLLAVVYDLGEEPVCRPGWVEAALGEIFRIAEERSISTLALPLLGVRHGRHPVTAFVDIFTSTLREARLRHLRKVWLPVEAEMAREVRSLLEAHARQHLVK